MANSIISQIFQLLQNLKSDATNLSKDLDEKDKREETRGDLSQLFKGFGELRSLMSKLEKSDIEKLQAEMRELMSGKEDILEYNRDVGNILMEVKKRTEAKKGLIEKVVQHLPSEKKHDNVGSLFDNWGSVLKNVQHWIEQSSQHKIGSR